MILVKGPHGDRPGGSLDPEHASQGRQRQRVADRRIGALPLEHIAEPSHQPLVGIGVHVAGRAPALADPEGAQVVDAVGLVGVVVGVEHRVHAADAGRGGLLAELRRGVDHHGGLGGPVDVGAAAHQHRAAGAAVPRIGRVAHAPVAVRTRHAAGGPAAQDGELQRRAHGLGIRSNRPKNASSVLDSASVRLQPRTSANFARICGRKAGSLRRPRTGTGAR